ncbi:hypothetical protein LMG27174_07305 [Paraburkholderia rhynchosiae]|uniref:Uncharacterized protein n=1 Tax=Paraburkholderia rhynchosiae TaxID=487049 RepID=A0A6J5CWG8_9BURK|nr:hypothetical protein LMG27174_07305 [Paraburkholderia rhynchosiae]
MDRACNGQQLAAAEPGAGRAPISRHRVRRHVTRDGLSHGYAGVPRAQHGKLVGIGKLDAA